jgi:hypothetical protein
LFIATLRLFAALKEQPRGPPRFLLAYKRRLRYRELPFFEWLAEEFSIRIWMVEGGTGHSEPGAIVVISFLWNVCIKSGLKPSSCGGADFCQDKLRRAV